MRKLFFIFFTLPLLCFSQVKISGKVVDEKNNTPLAFVNVTNGFGKGAISDIDGSFTIELPEKFTLYFSYVGYEHDTISSNEISFPLIVKLKKKSFNLNEVLITPGENPAHRIIKNVIRNKKLNDPEQYESFSYTSYNRMVFTGDKTVQSFEITDSIQEKDIQSFDSLLKRQHLFLMESVTKRFYKGPGRDLEKVLASRISGLKDPSFQLLASELQSFGFYKNTFALADIEYISPLSPSSTNNYLFIIEDTLPQSSDTVFIISFRPNSKSKFEGLKGLLYINTNGYALQNVIAEPADTNAPMQIKIQQKYELVNGKWFPVQLNTDIKMKELSIGPFSLIGMARSYLDSIQIGTLSERSKFSEVSVMTEPDANNQSDQFWVKYRIDSLSKKNEQTYHVIDSLGERYKLDRKMNILHALQTGEFPIGKVNLQLKHLINYNNYEGIRAGLGLKTNRRFSRYFSIEGYSAYGFKDKAFKYGGAFNLTPFDISDFRLRFEASTDVRESGSLWFESSTPNLGSEPYRDLFISLFDSVTKYTASFRFRTFRYNLVTLFASREMVNPTDSYTFYFNKGDGTSPLIDYDVVLAGAELRFAFREKFIQTTHSRISTGSKYPILYIRAEKSLPEYNTGLDFTRISARLESKYKLRYVGSGKLTIMAGMVNGASPYTWLFTPPGTTREFTLDSENSFQVMRVNEFVNDRFFQAFYSHNFGKLLFRTKRFTPELEIAQNFGIGALSNKEIHRGRELKSLSGGYFETGVKINNILVLSPTGIGLGAYYRYGTHSLPEFKDNLSFKMTLGFTF